MKYVSLNTKNTTFSTNEIISKTQLPTPDSARGRLIIAGCKSSSYLIQRVIERYKGLAQKDKQKNAFTFLDNIDNSFLDGETNVRIKDHINGGDVFLFQSLYNPVIDSSVNENYLNLLISARAFREHGAKHITAVLPYLAYARQDKPTRFMREPTTAKLMADLSMTSGIDRVIVWHPHSLQLHGFYAATPVNFLQSIPFFVQCFEEFQNRNDVIIVAPDEGAAKLTTYVADALNVSNAVAAKFRPKPEIVSATKIIGDFRGKKVALILDDIISSGNTINNVARTLVDRHAIQHIYIAVSHNLCLKSAYEILGTLFQKYNLRSVLVTNSIPQTNDFLTLPFFSSYCLSDILARVIHRIHNNLSVSQLFLYSSGDSVTC